MDNCFQHPKRKAEVTLRFYVDGGITEYSLCHNCRHATSIAALQLDGYIPPDYEIVDIEEG